VIPVMRAVFMIESVKLGDFRVIPAACGIKAVGFIGQIVRASGA